MKVTQSDIVRVAQQMPASPRVLARLSEVLADINSDTDDIVELVGFDAGITSGLIRLSNSALFSFSEPTTTLEEAIGRVGFREVYRLVGLASTRLLFPQQLELYGISGEQMWENSITTALAMEVLARRSRVMDDREAYTIGLLRSSGKIILSRLASNGETVIPYPGEEAVPYIEDWEKAHFGIGSNEAGAQLMLHWKFAPLIAEAVRHHGAPLESSSTPVEAVLLNVASGLVQQLGNGIPGETLNWRKHPDKFKRANISPEDADEALEEVRAELDKLRSAVSGSKL